MDTISFEIDANGVALVTVDVKDKPMNVITNEFMDDVFEVAERIASDDEVKGACEDCVGSVGATGLKDMGKVMGALKERYAGQMDFGKASGIVKELLS